MGPVVRSCRTDSSFSEPKVPFDAVGAVLGLSVAAGVALASCSIGNDTGAVAHAVGSVSGYLGGAAAGGLASAAWARVSPKSGGGGLGLMMAGSLGGIVAGNMAVGNPVASACLAAFAGVSLAVATVAVSRAHVRAPE